MRADRRPAAIAKSLLAGSICLLTPGCTTAGLWESANRRDCHKAAAVALTPVTVALDATLIAGWIWLECEADRNDCCSSPPRRCR